MKNLRCLCSFLIIPLMFGCAHVKPKPVELKKNFQLTAVKMETTADSSFQIYMFPLNENSPRKVLYPKFKGIPDSLRKVRKYVLCMDEVQAVFQAYKAGVINRDDCLNFLRKQAKDTIQSTPDYVKTFIVFITGFSKMGKQYCLFDSNNNYDLGDDYPFILSKSNYRNEPHKMFFEKSINGRIQSDSTWIALSGDKNNDFLKIKFCEQTLSAFNYDSVSYRLLVSPAYGQGVNYSDDVIFELSDTIHTLPQVFGSGQYAKLKNLYFQVNCNFDGRSVFFKLDSNALVKGSTQLNMPAIPFHARTLKGDSILFPETFKGKYILLDFWSTSCPHCIDDIRNTYRNLYKKYAGEKFEIVGIADDPASRVEWFVSQNMISWTMISAPKSPIQGFYRIDAYPALYLINPDGVIIAKGKELAKEKITAVIEKYLGNK